MADRRRGGSAFMAAGAAALMVWGVALAVHTVVTDGAVRAAGLVPYIFMGGILLGVPLIVGILVVVAAPAYLLIRRFAGISLPVTLAVGVGCGLLGREVIVRLLGRPESDFVPVLVVIAAGLGAAAAWWRVWTRPARDDWARGGIA